ncbi:MAG: dephospho-CoA kinase, partial [Abitibacteriaceae bacterium]|nr:dephospho-CoA kinase [Abditibacteriaceae bacterium]
DPEFATRVAALFPESVLTSEGTVDRIKVAAVVFKDRTALLRLEALVHPAVAALRDQKIKAVREVVPASPIVLEAVKLIESGQAMQCDAVWCVTCLPEVQRQRLMQDRGLSESAARERLENQPPLDQKAKLIGAIPLVMIENNGSLEMLESHVEQEWHKLLAEGIV